uniref:Uncharacterized protein n=1 Tax=Ascaris lumbricoides TaxID=6252 RepID=A0A0M3HVX0_ASCLU
MIVNMGMRPTSPFVLSLLFFFSHQASWFHFHISQANLS